MIATGDIRDPVTRQPMSPDELARLARVSKRDIPSIHELARIRIAQVNRHSLTTLLIDDILFHARRHFEYATDIVDLLRESLVEHPDELRLAVECLKSRGVVCG